MNTQKEVTKGKTLDQKKVLWLVSAILFVIPFLSYYYMDLKSLTVWSSNFWDSVFIIKDVRKFYAYSALNAYGLEHEMVGSDILIYIPWAIWNLPIWAIQYFGKIPIVYSTGMLLYSKCFLLVVLFLIVKVMYQIFVLGNQKEHANLGIYLFLSSSFVMYGIAYAGQNDVIVILLYLNSIYQLMKKNKKGFIIWAALSIACKPFFIFSYIAVVLLIEKKIHKILLYMLSSVSLVVVQKLLFMGAPSYKESLAAGPISQIFVRMVYANLSTPPFVISFFFLTLFVVYVMAYFTVLEEKDSTIVNIVYFSLIPLICYFGFVHDSFYRLIYVFVLWSILIVFKMEYFRINILIEILYTAAYAVMSLLMDYYFMWPAYRLGVNQTPQNMTIPDRIEMMITGDPTIYAQISNSLCFLLLVMIVVINHPKFASKNKVLLMEAENYLPILRMLVYVFPLAVSFYFSIVG